MAVIKPKDIDDLSIIDDTTISIGAIGTDGYSYSHIEYGPTISVSDTLTLGNIAFSNTASGTFSIGSGLNSNTAAIWTTNTAHPSVVGSALGHQGGKLSLSGENADIDLNGKSMKAWMEKVEERLNILTPNPELEKEWDELRKLGERYRKLEKKCKEKAEVWKKLKSMPPPKVV